MSAVDIELLPEELRSRVRAATAHASHRLIHPLEASDEGGRAYAVEAVSGDRVTRMRLGLRPDGSVEEHTDSFTVDDIVALDAAAAELTVRGPSGTRVVPLAPETLDAVEVIRTWS